MASTEKYDRQLRLWGRNGQKALVESRVLLLGASCTGSETLKNIVLPGCGSITIVDDAIVNEGDVASNFFTRSSDIGRPRAEAVKEWMCEMNPDTQSSKHIVQSPSDYISSRNGDFTSFTLIIATQLPATILRELGKACAASGVPLLVVRTYGLIGYVRVVLPRKDHPIVQDHKMNDTSDQWIQNPWPALNDWRNSFHLDQQTKVDHIHTPWPVILHHLLAKFKAEHGEEAFSQLTRAQLGDYVLDYSLQHRTKLYEAEMISKQEDAPEPEKPAGGGSSPLNYLEAKSRCYKALSPAEIPYGLKKVLDDPRAASPVVAGGGGGGGGAAAAGTNPVAAEGYTTFWILMQAINRFKEKEGRGYLPVTGTVVDMTASSVTYIAMQTQHQEQHARDVVCVTKHAHDILQECGQSVSSLITTPFADDIETMVSIVIKNIREVSVAKTTTIEEEYTNKGCDGNGDPQPSTTLSETFMMAPFDGEKNPEMTGCLWYVMLRACDRFWKDTGAYPGANVSLTEEQLKSEANVVMQHATEIQSELGYSWEAGYEKAAAEMTRYGGTEVHTVAAYVGGVAGQEAVKLISHQYTPLNSTYVYNGINGSAGSYLF